MFPIDYVNDNACALCETRKNCFGSGSATSEIFGNVYGGDFTVNTAAEIASVAYQR